MSAILKIYTDSGHTSEVARTPNIQTITTGSTLTIGTTAIPVASSVGMPSAGFIDIDTGGNLETLYYVSITGNTLNLATATTISHAGGTSVVQWFYQLNVGDQTNGIINDGTMASPNGSNTATWYLYNAGDQTASTIVMALSNAIPPSTINGYTDTLLSITNGTTGFSNSLSLSNMASGATQQFWATVDIPAGQAISGSSNPQICVVLITFTSL